MPFSSISYIDRALLSATTPGQSGPGSNGNEAVLRITQSPSIAGTSPSDCLVSYHDIRCRGAVRVFYGPSRLGSIVHRLWQVFGATSRILTYLLYVCSSWSSYFCLAICGVHRSTSLMSSSLLLQQCPACLVRLTWIVFVMGGRWPYSWYLVGCCRQDLFNIARNIVV